MAVSVPGIFGHSAFSGGATRKTDQKAAAAGFAQVFTNMLAKRTHQSMVGEDSGPMGTEGGLERRYLWIAAGPGAGQNSRELEIDEEPHRDDLNGADGIEHRQRIESQLFGRVGRLPNHQRFQRQW
jgi:hypothetical protein